MLHENYQFYSKDWKSCIPSLLLKFTDIKINYLYFIGINI